VGVQGFGSCRARTPVRAVARRLAGEHAHHGRRASLLAQGAHQRRRGGGFDVALRARDKHEPQEVGARTPGVARIVEIRQAAYLDRRRAVSVRKQVL